MVIADLMTNLEIPILTILLFLVYRLENLKGRIEKIESLLKIPVNLIEEQSKNGIITKFEDILKGRIEKSPQEIKGLNILKEDNLI